VVFHKDVEFQFCYHNTFFVIIRLFLTFAKVRMFFILIFVGIQDGAAGKLIEFVWDGGSGVGYRAG
jgi:hypothetical protein